MVLPDSNTMACYYLYQHDHHTVILLQLLNLSLSAKLLKWDFTKMAKMLWSKSQDGNTMYQQTEYRNSSGNKSMVSYFCLMSFWIEYLWHFVCQTSPQIKLINSPIMSCNSVDSMVKTRKKNPIKLFLNNPLSIWSRKINMTNIFPPQPPLWGKKKWALTLLGT